MTEYNKINGFHVGIPAYTQGIGQWVQLMAQNGIPFTTKAVDNTGSLMDAQPLIQGGLEGYAIWRHYNIGGSGNDNPNYNNTPEQEAERYWSSAVAKFPPELDKNVVWIELINEPDKNKADWLGQVAYGIGKRAIRDGYKVLCLGWSSGEPEPEAWVTGGMQMYLSLCSQYPNQVGISVHEYQFDVNKTLMDNYPYQIGRYQNIHTACDHFGYNYPTIFLSEFGWAYQQIPPVEDAIVQIIEVRNVYAPTNVKGAAIWALDTGQNWDNIGYQVHKLMWKDSVIGSESPLYRAIRDFPIEDVPKPPPTKHKAIVVKIPQEANESEWVSLADYSYQYKHTLTASHDDALYILKNGNDESYAKIYKPQLPSQQGFIQLLNESGINWVAITV